MQPRSSEWGRHVMGAVIVVVAMGRCPLVGADDQPQGDVTVEKTAERLHFKVPPDWPVERRNGILMPIPIEEYLARKFKALETSTQALEQQVNGLDLRLRVVEEESKKVHRGLQSAEQPDK